MPSVIENELFFSWFSFRNNKKRNLACSTARRNEKRWCTIITKYTVVLHRIGLTGSSQYSREAVISTYFFDNWWGEEVASTFMTSEASTSIWEGKFRVFLFLLSFSFQVGGNLIRSRKRPYICFCHSSGISLNTKQAARKIISKTFLFWNEWELPGNRWCWSYSFEITQ